MPKCTSAQPFNDCQLNLPDAFSGDIVRFADLLQRLLFAAKSHASNEYVSVAFVEALK